MDDLKYLMNKYVHDNIKYGKVGLLFSCGMDSLSILFSMLENGIRPTIYTFRTDNYISEDFKRSKKLADELKLEFEEILVPTSPVAIENDVRYIIRRFKVKKKTQIQCIHPFIYVDKSREDVYVSGLCADDLYGTSRKMSVLGGQDEKFLSIRIAAHNNKESSSYKFIKQIFNDCGKDFLCPYKESESISSYLLAKTYSQLNKPKQKNVMYEAYKQYLDTYNLYRRNSGLQCNSKLREAHDELLGTQLNEAGNKSVVAIYNKLYKEELNKWWIY